MWNLMCVTYKKTCSPHELICEDSYAIIREMLCEFIIKDVIPPGSRFYYAQV
ncbi:hypothetical protein PVAP13_6NG148306 [Panicum virgatum]|uniref:Uncharacterized protein n=1 Tax=Panicum virgatum TaxID=38727 RepID=A0A8T0R1W4_PANVG|nr:hypothetical protein PVAP13_6NG148306 [Panicum virgatum]